MKYIEPFCDILLQTQDYFPEQLNDQIREHSQLSSQLISTLEEGKRSEFDTLLQKFVELNPYNYRVLLYLPFSIYNEPTNKLMRVVHDGWERLSRQADARENFNLGDTLEPEHRKYDARNPRDLGDGLTRVVKYVHLLPFIFDYFSTLEFMNTINEHNGDAVFLCSIGDILPVMEAFKIINHKECLMLGEIIGGYADFNYQQEVFSSDSRTKWLMELENHQKVKLTNLIGPMIENFDVSIINHLSLDDQTIVRFGGSRLKGYGREESDYDTWPIKIGGPATENPNDVHIVFNTVFVGQNEQTLRAEQFRLAKRFMLMSKHSSERRKALEKLEQDHLQYRLMHKGFPYAYDDISARTRKFTTIDGGSAFYDDRYRLVATKLFFKYVFLPQL